MIAQNPLAALPQSQINEQQEPAQCGLAILFQNVLKTTSKISYLKFLNLLESKISSNSGRIGTAKLISKKMRSKLLSWIENLALETFEFSVKTLISAIKILDQYLSLTNESPSSLQLIGCACLYLAAKTYEPTIVAGQCYVVASANSFTEQQLFEKEIQIYRALGYNTNFICPFRVYKSIPHTVNYTILGNCSPKDLERLFLEITKNLEFSSFKTIHIIPMVLAFCGIQHRIPTSVELLQHLKNLKL